MTDTWAAKVLEGVPRFDHCDDGYEARDRGAWVTYGAALAAIARMGAGGKLVERATAALEGVTEGPWRVDGEPWNQIVWSGAENRVCFMAHSNGLDDDRDIATARFIAFARQWVPEAAAHIAALTAELAEAREQNRWAYIQAAMDDRQTEAEAEAAALRAKVARLEGVLTDMPKAVLRTTVCQGPQWPDDRPGVWLAALEACAKSVQAAVDAALTDGDSNE